MENYSYFDAFSLLGKGILMLLLCLLETFCILCGVIWEYKKPVFMLICCAVGAAAFVYVLVSAVWIVALLA